MRPGDINWNEEFQRLMDAEWREDIPQRARRVRKLTEDFGTAARTLLMNAIGTQAVIPRCGTGG
jgi:hypothetical protein